MRTSDRAAAQLPNQPGKSSSQPKTARPVPDNSVNTTIGRSTAPSSSASVWRAVSVVKNIVNGTAVSSANRPICAETGEADTTKFALKRVFKHSLTASAHCAAPAKNGCCTANSSTRYPTASASAAP